MKRYIQTISVLIITLFLLAFLSHGTAFAATLGNTAINSTYSSGWYNRMYLAQVLVSSTNAGYVYSGSVYESGTSVSTTVYAAVYTDSGGVPSTLLGVSNGVVIAANQTYGWVNFTFSSPFQVTAGTNYWIAYYSDGPGTTAQSGGPMSKYTTSAIGDYTSANSYYMTVGNAPVPSTISSPTNFGNNNTYSLYLNTYAAPTITSPTNTSITTTTATLGGNVTSDGGSTITGRGVCIGTSANPTTSGTCFTTSGTTGTFTVSATGLSSNTTYHYRAYATNSIGTSYTTDDTFTSLSAGPTGVSANTATNVNSYYVTLNGSANPAGYATTGHFRIYTSDPGNCTSDSGGTRVPVSTGGTDDVSVGSDSTSHNFSYTTTYENPGYLTPQTQYWVCAYAVNTNGTIGSSADGTFTTPDGPANPCDAPTSGNLVIPSGASCSFPGSTYDGVSSTSSITFSSGSVLTANPGQTIARGSSMIFSGGTLTLGGGSLVRGGVYIKDADGDGVIDASASTYGYVGTTPPSGYVQRSTISSSYNYSKKVLDISTFDCDDTNGNIYQNVGNLVTDADHDGYKTSAAAATQCVGAAASFNGRTYYKDASGNYTWLPSAAELGGGATDCDDTNSAGTVVQTYYKDNDGDGKGAASTIQYKGGTPGSGSYSNSFSTTTSLTVNAPAGLQSGVVEIASLIISANFSTTITAPSGWTLIQRVSDNSSSSSLAIYWKASGDSEPSSYTWTAGSGVHYFQGNIVAYDNVNTTSPIDTSSYSASGNSGSQVFSIPTASISTSTSNELVVAIFDNLSTTTVTAPSGMTERFNSDTGGYGIEYADVMQSTAGSTGSKTASISPSGYGVGVILALKSDYGATTACVPPANYVANNTDCNDNTSSLYQNLTAYPDNDGDGYYATTGFNVCSGASLVSGMGSATQGTDCYDLNSNAYPNETTYYTTDRGDGSYDYDCSGTITNNAPAGEYACTTSFSGYLNISGCTSSGPWCTGISSSFVCGDSYGNSSYNHIVYSNTSSQMSIYTNSTCTTTTNITAYNQGSTYFTDACK